MPNRACQGSISSFFSAYLVHDFAYCGSLNYVHMLFGKMIVEMGPNHARIPSFNSMESGIPKPEHIAQSCLAWI